MRRARHHARATARPRAIPRALATLLKRNDRAIFTAAARAAEAVNYLKGEPAEAHSKRRPPSSPHPRQPKSPSGQRHEARCRASGRPACRAGRRGSLKAISAGPALRPLLVCGRRLQPFRPQPVRAARGTVSRAARRRQMDRRCHRRAWRSSRSHRASTAAQFRAALDTLAEAAHLSHASPAHRHARPSRRPIGRRRGPPTLCGRRDRSRARWPRAYLRSARHRSSMRRLAALRFHPQLRLIADHRRAAAGLARADRRCHRPRRLYHRRPSHLPSARPATAKASIDRPAPGHGRSPRQRRPLPVFARFCGFGGQPAIAQPAPAQSTCLQPRKASRRCSR